MTGYHQAQRLAVDPERVDLCGHRRISQGADRHAETGHVHTTQALATDDLALGQITRHADPHHGDDLDTEGILAAVSGQIGERVDEHIDRLLGRDDVGLSLRTRRLLLAGVVVTRQLGFGITAIGADVQHRVDLGGRIPGADNQGALDGRHKHQHGLGPLAAETGRIVLIEKMGGAPAVSPDERVGIPHADRVEVNGVGALEAGQVRAHRGIGP